MILQIDTLQSAQEIATNGGHGLTWFFILLLAIGVGVIANKVRGRRPPQSKTKPDVF